MSCIYDIVHVGNYGVMHTMHLQAHLQFHEELWETQYSSLASRYDWQRGYILHSCELYALSYGLWHASKHTQLPCTQGEVIGSVVIDLDHLGDLASAQHYEDLINVTVWLQSVW